MIQVRKSLGINKAEAARRLNMSAMGYGRYENGNREPSFQTVSYIASTFNTSVDYLYGITDNSENKTITISKENNKKLYVLIETIKDDPDLTDRLFMYLEKLQGNTIE